MGLPTTELCLGPGPISVGFGTPASRPKIEDLVERLEEEMRKIESFKRELPLSLSIVKQVVDAMKEELVRWGEEGGRSKIVHHPILEEFLPVFTSSFQPEEGEEENETRWMSSDRPWSSHGDGVRNDSDDENAVRFAKSFKGFPSFCGTHEVPDGAKKVAVSLPDLSLFTPGIDGSPFVSSVPKEPKSCPPHAKSKPLVGGSLSASTSAPANGHGQTQQQTAAKKPRRCWSPELHGKFVGALKQLGGSHVATPKQIREMMMVDGLTNDEVKSHLQKYRLHIQKVPLSSSLANETEACVESGLINGAPLIASSRC